nr:hypothetical protein [Saccharothrix carnea]
MQVSEDYVRDVIHAFNERRFAALDPKWSGGRSRTIGERICLIARTAPADWASPHSPPGRSRSCANTCSTAAPSPRSAGRRCAASCATPASPGRAPPPGRPPPTRTSLRICTASSTSTTTRPTTDV